MIIIAIVRAAGSLLPGGVTDTVWLFFWQVMEAAVAVIMVALTGSRSLFHTDLYTQRKSVPTYGSDNPLRTMHSGATNRYNKLGGSRTTASQGIPASHASTRGVDHTTASMV